MESGVCKPTKRVRWADQSEDAQEVLDMWVRNNGKASLEGQPVHAMGEDGRKNSGSTVAETGSATGAQPGVVGSATGARSKGIVGSATGAQPGVVGSATGARLEGINSSSSTGPEEEEVMCEPCGPSSNPDEEEEHESAKVKRARDVTGPSKQEMEDHWASGHVTFRSWCQHCMAGRGRDRRHTRQTTEESSEEKRKRQSLFCQHGLRITQAGGRQRKGR